MSMNKSKGDSNEKNVKKNFPNGGFPPLILCKNVTPDKKKTRSYKTSSDLVSINEILKKKKNMDTFFSI